MDAYISAMTQIKLRIDLMNKIRIRKIDLLYDVPIAEFCTLQIRMITETIVLASLAANRELFEASQKKFSQHWHPKKIIHDIERLNKDFYPVPVIETAGKLGNPEREINNKSNGFLTKQELIEIHGKCGNILHARLPSNKRVVYSKYIDWTRECTKKIMELLNSHTIKLLDDEVFYLVQMHSEPEGRIAHYEFVRID